VAVQMVDDGAEAEGLVWPPLRSLWLLE